MENIQETQNKAYFRPSIQPDFSEWKEKEFKRLDGSTYKKKVEPSGIGNKIFKDLNGKEYLSICVPKGMEINGVKIGGAHFMVPKGAVFDIDPNHEKAKKFEKEPGYANSHKLVILKSDYNLQFSYKNYNKDNGKCEWVEKTTATAGEYQKSCKAFSNKIKDNLKYKNATRDAISESKNIIADKNSTQEISHESR